MISFENFKITLKKSLNVLSFPSVKIGFYKFFHIFQRYDKFVHPFITYENGHDEKYLHVEISWLT